ncbi:MAG: protein kinase [Acidobacteriota bacterium]|nr:protein kinase [Acidobacteriota bacterium]
MGQQRVELSAGTRLGPYEIVAPLGAGPTGRVYRARDMGRGRDVAIKVLSRDIAIGSKQWQKLEREIAAAIRLRHPHIRATYDLQRRNEIDFLVMEYIEGETLASRLERGPLPIREMLGIGIQVAEALGAAHEQGVIHGGLKPTNVLISGNDAKLLDFCQDVVRPKVPEPPSSPARIPPSCSDAVMACALAYMAPEQIEGKEPDARSDIFAFGAVLYEMAGGKRAFAGTSPPGVIAAVLASEPPLIGSQRTEIPPEIDRLVRTCLAKIPAERPHSSHDLEGELKWIRDRVSEPGAPMTDHGQRRSLEHLAWWTAIGALILAVGMILAYLRRPSSRPPQPKIQAMIKLPRNFAVASRGTAIAFSPGGRKLVVVGDSESEEQPRLWLRTAEGAVWKPLAGTEGASFPFWAPDGRSIAFFADQMLKRIDLSNGAILTICAALDGRGGSWNKKGTIVFAPVASGGLYRVAAAGGTPIQVTVPGSPGISHRIPEFLPDGEQVVFFSKVSGLGERSGIYLLDLRTSQSRFLVHSNSAARYVEPGYLAFLRNGDLIVQPFSASGWQLRGQPIKVADNVRGTEGGAGEFSFSSAGSLLYQNDSEHVRAQLTWFSLDGKQLATVGKPQEFTSMTLSPNGRSAALGIADTEGTAPIWIYGLADATRRLLTPRRGSIADLVWSPDARQIAYDDGTTNLYAQAVTSKAPTQKLWSGRRVCPTAWSPDGRLLAIDVTGDNGVHIWLVPIKGKGKPYPLSNSSYNQSGGTFSADGRWIAYISDESGERQLYAIPFPGGGPATQISTTGVVTGGWVPGQAKLAYETPDGRLFTVEAHERGNTLVLGQPQELLGGHHLETNVRIPGLRCFSSDGEHVLLPVPLPGERESKTMLMLVTNWQADVKD